MYFNNCYGLKHLTFLLFIRNISLSIFLDEVRKLLFPDWLFGHRADGEIRILGGFAKIWFRLARILLFSSKFDTTCKRLKSQRD